MKVVITGGAGFIGSHFVDQWVNNNPEDEVTVIDKLTYAGDMCNISVDSHQAISFIQGDICDKKLVDELLQNCDLCVNFASETHVDRSITNSFPFIETDINGTHNLLEAARKHDVRFVQISTDEVYGSRTQGSFLETDKLNPSSPYSAAKASADLLVNAYYKTYGLKTTITRSSNNYGPKQYPEKLIPVLILKALDDQPIPLYHKGENIRDWLYVTDNCNAIETVIKKGKQNADIYNIGSGTEKSNLEVAIIILHYLDKSDNLISFVGDRPGHDFRYSVDDTKLKKLGWRPETNFNEGIQKTIEWYRR